MRLRNRRLTSDGERALLARDASHVLFSRTSQLVVTVTGFQLYKDANEFYFSQECAAAAASPHRRTLTLPSLQLPPLRRRGQDDVQQVPGLRIPEEGP